jgi:two-component system heavy metal sensor histidine kinase CusS
MAGRFAIFRRPPSLALRVTALVGIATLLVILVFNWITVRALEQHFAAMDADELGAASNAVIRALREVHTGINDRALDHVVSGQPGVYYSVVDTAGRTVYAEADGPRLSRFIASHNSTDLADTREMPIWQEGGKSYRGAAVRVGGTAALGNDTYIIAVAIDIGVHLSFLQGFRRIQLWTSSVVLCIAILVAWFAVKWGHIPIRRLTARVRAITSSKLHVRLNPGEVPIELEDLVASFNDMLKRIEDGFVQLSNFSADIAHELRTPVTNLTTQTEVALGQARSADEYREVLYSNLEEFGRMSRMISNMLFLAQTENGTGNLRLADVDLTESVRGLFEYFEAWADDRAVSLDLQGWAGPVRGNEEMLRRAIGNLLSNAIRHSPRGASVTVTLSQDEWRTTVRVENAGEQIPGEALPRIFDRFYRADPSRQRKGEGAGLGLAIVKSVAEAHGGTVHVVSDDTLTRFELVLPRSA